MKVAGRFILTLSVTQRCRWMWASIKGGEIPIEPMSLRWPVATAADKRYLADVGFQQKVKKSLRIDDVDFTKYDLIYMIVSSIFFIME